MRWIEEDLYVPKVRPLSKMEDNIKDHLHEVSNYELSGKKNMHFIGSITSNQYNNVRHLVTGSWRPARTAYKSHRKGYEFSDAQKRMAEEIKKKCMGRDDVCSLVIQRQGKEETERYVSEFKFLATKETGSFPKPDPFLLICTTLDQKKRDVNLEYFSDEATVRKYLKQEGEEGGCSEGATILKIDEITEAHPKIATRKHKFDRVKYFTLD